ncbi:MAG TPA: caspase family protein, partial [Blastocatellia bacterium]|nr:caspase family protein [Blastocatellia bacterium]
MKTKRTNIMKGLPAVAVAFALTATQVIFYTAITTEAQTDQRGRPPRQAVERASEKISKWPPREKRFAIIIGVDEYTDSKITPLIAPSEDAHMLYDALIKYADFPRENITLLTNDRSSLNQPTRPIILEYLSNLRKLLPPDGLLLVAFSGHGIEVEGQAFLLGADARLNDDLKVLRDTAISWTDMMEYIADSGVGQVVMLLDACRNDPRSGKSAPRPNQITQLYSRGVGLKTYKSKITGYAKLLATSMGEQAWEDAEKRQGFFMGAIVDGIKGAAANEDGKVTLASLIKYTKNEVTQRALRRGLTQAPSEEILNYDTDQIVIAEFETKAKPAVTTAARNEELPAYMPDFELAFWQSVEKRDEPAEYELYLKRYPNGVYAELAKSRIARLRKAQSASPAAAAPAEVRPGATVKSDVKSDARSSAVAKADEQRPEDDIQAELKRQQLAQQAERQKQEQLEAAYWRSIINSA